MKRADHLIERIADGDNLRLAFWKASKGKRARADVLAFRDDLDGHLCRLRAALLEGSHAWGPYHSFCVCDPKERTIYAPPLRDQVAQHAIMNVCGERFERFQIHDSYASRKGKGLDAAIARSRQFARHGDWYLKLDVRKYFDSVDHATLQGLLRRQFKDVAVLSLFGGIIASYTATPGRGLPLGNLTSQFFANHYLGVFDHFVKQTLGCRRYVRYMDDFVIWSNDRAALKRIAENCGNYLQTKLKLTMKAPCLNACGLGMTFLGYRIFPGQIRLSRRSRDRFRRRLRQFDDYHRRGIWSDAEAARHVEPLLAFVRRADSRAFLERVMMRPGGFGPQARTA
jgi:retron-type reverse transcriptase